MDFEEVYTREFPGVYKYLLALCGNPVLAEELTQETFYRAIQNSKTFRGTCKLSVWLCQIGKNLYISQLRQERHRKPLPLDDMDQQQITHPDPEEALLHRDTAMSLHRLLHGKIADLINDEHLVPGQDFEFVRQDANKDKILKMK